jgi:hypothetical protein
MQMVIVQMAIAQMITVQMTITQITYWTKILVTGVVRNVTETNAIRNDTTFLNKC